MLQAKILFTTCKLSAERNETILYVIFFVVLWIYHHLLGLFYKSIKLSQSNAP